MGVLDLLRPRLRPDFMVIGAQKAGTSALFNLLAHHPSVSAPRIKELHYFDHPHHRSGMSGYVAHFPRRPWGLERTTTFEATPSYLYIPEVPARIHRLFPDMRFVAVLRDPVERAYSAWNMFRSFGPSHPAHHLHDPRSFEQAVQEEIAGLPIPLAHRYLDRGLYSLQLQRYFELFGRERILIIPYSRFKSRTSDVLAEVLSFVGLPDHRFSVEELGAKDNQRPYPAGMEPATREQLVQWFRSEHKALSELLEPGTDRPYPY